MKYKRGDTIKVRASEFCGTPVCDAIVLSMHRVGNQTFYDVTADREIFQVDAGGYILVGPPRLDGRLTRAI